MPTTIEVADDGTITMNGTKIEPGSPLHAMARQMAEQVPGFIPKDPPLGVLDRALEAGQNIGEVTGLGGPGKTLAQYTLDAVRRNTSPEAPGTPPSYPISPSNPEPPQGKKVTHGFQGPGGSRVPSSKTDEDDKES